MRGSLQRSGRVQVVGQYLFVLNYCFVLGGRFSARAGAICFGQRGGQLETTAHNRIVDRICYFDNINLSGWRVDVQRRRWLQLKLTLTIDNSAIAIAIVNIR